MKNVLLAVPLLVAGAAVTAGCSPTSSASSAAPSSSAPAGAAPSASTAPPSSASPSATASPAPASTGRGTSTGSGAGASASGTPACTTAHLAASLETIPGGDGMNQQHVGLQLKNTGSSACTLYGYPGVSWVTGASGKQVGPGAPRQSDPSGGPEKTVTLAPGALASAPLDIADAAAVTSKSECDPVKVGGLRVYPPGQKAALFIPEGTPDNDYACSKTTSRYTDLTIGYLQSGPQAG